MSPSRLGEERTCNLAVVTYLTLAAVSGAVSALVSEVSVLSDETAVVVVVFVVLVFFFEGTSDLNKRIKTISITNPMITLVKSAVLTVGFFLFFEDFFTTLLL